VLLFVILKIELFFKIIRATALIQNYSYRAKIISQNNRQNGCNIPEHVENSGTRQRY